MIGRAGFGAMLVACAFTLDAGAIAGLIWIALNPIKMDAGIFGIIMGVIGIIIGHVNAMAQQPVSWAFGSTAGSQEKDKTISTLAGKP